MELFFRKLSAVFIGLGAVGISGCTSVSSYTPSARLESPEVPGAGHFRIAIGGNTAQSVQLTGDGSARPPTLSNSIGSTLEMPTIRASVGIAEDFEIELRTSTPGPIVLKGKFQILGMNAQTATEDNLSLAVTVGIGVDEESRSGNQNGLFGSGGYNWSSRIDDTQIDYAVILGSRPSPRFLIFGGPFLTTHSLSGSINQAQSDNGSSPAANYNLSGSGNSYGVDFGFQFFFGQSRKFSLMVDFAEQRFEWVNAATQTNAGAGVLFEVLL